MHKNNKLTTHFYDKRCVIAAPWLLYFECEKREPNLKIYFRDLLYAYLQFLMHFNAI